MSEMPNPERAPDASAQVERIRTELVDAGAATRRALERARLARLIILAAVQVAIAYIAWRAWTWRARRRRA